MKHIKLFEGFYSDKIAEVEKELANHMKNDLANWINEFKDELDDVHSTDPWYYSNEKVMISELVISFKNKEIIRGTGFQGLEGIITPSKSSKIYFFIF